METALTIRHDPILAYREGHDTSWLEKLSNHRILPWSICPVAAVAFSYFFGRSILGKIGFFILGGAVGALGVPIARRKFEKHVDQSREETDDMRKAFCRAVLENDVERRPIDARKGILECISSFFLDLFGRKPKDTMEKNECGEPLTKRGYVLSVGGRDKIVLQRIAHILVESLMRCSTQVRRTSLPIFLSPCATKLQDLQRDFRKLSTEEQQKFSLLDETQDASSTTSIIIAQASFAERLLYRIRPPLALWNRAKKVVQHLCEMQGENAEEMWSAFNYAANDIRKALFPNPQLRH